MAIQQESRISRVSAVALSNISYNSISDLIAISDLSKDRRDATSRQHWFIVRGGGVAVINHQTFTLRAGDELTIPINAMYRLELLPDTEGFIFSGSDDFFRSRVAPALYTTEGALHDRYYKPLVCRRLPGDSMNATRQRIAEEITRAATHFGMGCDAAVMGYIFVLMTNRNLPNEPENQDNTKLNLVFTDLLYQFQVLVEKHYLEHLSINDYSVMLGVTRVKLIETCKQLLDKTPIEIIHDRIVVEAKHQLLTVSKRVNEVAYALGFDDSAYFSRFFKNRTRESPSDYRQKYIIDKL